MSARERWITWGLAALAAVLAAIAAGRPITLPPLPVNPAPVPPDAAPITPAPAQPDPLGAIIRISRPGTGCSATIIGPKRIDGRYWVLSAAHCCRETGERWTGRLRDGRTVGLVVVSIDREPDVAWMLTDVDGHGYPFALLADSTPPVGTRVWHAGYGVDKPANREDGAVTGAENAEGQVEYRLSVSSGDSGGGIIMDGAGRVLSPVCCTTAPGQVARVWGASPERCRRAQTVSVSLDEWIPIPIPTRPKE